MSKPANIIKLLLVEDSLEDAERLTSVLRNAGITVRAAQARNATEFESQLQTQTPDLILISVSNASPTLSDAVSAAKRGGKDISVIALLDALAEDDVSSALHDDANAVALRTRNDQFVAVVRREAESLAMRRSVRRLESALRESERRNDSLLESSRDPIAYVHEGMHVRANNAYLEMFGYDEFSDIEGVSILDMIAPGAADGFKTLLKNLSKGEKPPAKLDIKARDIEGKTFDAVMEFSEASFEGEPCQQIVLRKPMASAELAAEIDALRSKDLITDLFNRQHGLAELDRLVADAAAGGSNLCLLLVEPDQFRKQLDTIGIGNADLLLGDMANLLRRHIDAADVAARMGEHTFGVLLRSRDADAARKLAEGLRRAFEEHIFEIGKQSISVSISIGGALIGEKNANAQTVLSQASTALRGAADEGGNRVSVLDPGLQDRAAASEMREMLNRVQNA
ncbi:MAG: diguanylate cyclase, partial [Rudaea sp.]